MLPVLLSYISNWCSTLKQHNQSLCWCKEPTNQTGTFHQIWERPLQFVQMTTAKTALPLDIGKQRARRWEEHSQSVKDLKDVKAKKARKDKVKNKTLTKLQ